MPPKIIEELVERFERNLPAYKSQGYKEDQLRQEFINPFFEALGWDVYNKAGVAPAYRDVIHQDSIKMAKGTKAPDYCFTLSGRRMFFVEAKKPFIDIKKDIHPAYQLRRYAWSAKLPLSILTDFEGFAVYESRKRPKKDDKASTERVMYLTYKDYIEKWDEIYNIFSKEAIMQGSFDRFIESAKKKRGTAEVDDEFLKEIEGWREELAQNIALRNPDLSVRELNYAVQRTIDRIIFLRMCEDRGVESYGQLLSLFEEDNIYWALCKIYIKADEKYNSGIFHFKKEKGRATLPDCITLELTIDDKVLKKIIKYLYYPDCPYEFSVLSPEILGNVYEQFLGKVIRLTPSHRAKVEEKPEVKKAGGVYYTPKYIVDYIVENTVGKLCKGKSPRKISKLRILDPACGSGSFLLEAYTYILNYHLDSYSKLKNPKQYKDEIYQGKNGDWYLTIKEKKRILLNNIYGVDIDEQAVEVTKLSLLLKVLEGESKDVLEKQQKLWRERALPDLGNNIKCGNSLISLDFYKNRQTTLFSEEDEYEINAFDWEKEFPEIMKKGGFDAVIGNPPYARIQTLTEHTPIQAEELKKKYASAQSGNFDIYVVFIERGLQLLNPYGILGYICPHKFFNAKYGKPLRGLISNGRHLSKIVHFGDQQVFKDATTYTCLLFFDKRNKYKFEFEKVSNLVAWRAKGETIKGKISLKEVTDNEWNFMVGEGIEVYNKVQKLPTKLGEIAHIFQGLVTGGDRAFILDSKKDIESELLHPYLKSDSIQAYGFPQINKWMLFPYYIRQGKALLIPKREFQERYPKAWKHLKECEPFLRGRERGRWDHNRWYAFGRSQNLSQMEEQKLIIQVLSLTPRVILDNRSLYMTGGGGGPFYGLRPKDDKNAIFYLLGILNSKIFGFIIEKQSTKMRGGYIRFSKQYIENFPIYTIDFSDTEDKARHDNMVKLVKRMLNLYKKLAGVKTPTEKERLQRQIDATDQQINSLVYELYGLTEEEIRVVEGN